MESQKISTEQLEHNEAKGPIHNTDKKSLFRDLREPAGLPQAVEAFITPQTPQKIPDTASNLSHSTDEIYKNMNIVISTNEIDSKNQY